MLQQMTPVSPVCQISCEGALVREFVQPPGLSIRPHAHEEATLVVVVSGAVYDRFGSREFPLAPGDLLVRPAGEMHAHRYGAEGAHVVAFSFSPTALEQPVPRIRTGSLRMGTHVLLRELHAEDPEGPVALSCCLAEVLHELTETQLRERAVPAWLRRTRDVLHDGSGLKPSLHQLAALAGVHPGHLSRVFRAHFHVSIGEYMRERRIQSAERLLVEGRQQLAEIALECGFFDQSHLIRAFRHTRGMTPTRWLKMRGLYNRKTMAE